MADRQPQKTSFPLGQLVATPAAIALLESVGMTPLTLHQRHAAGDWGDLGEDDRQANEQALSDGGRIFSAYKLSCGRVWIITEAADDRGRRASTCVLMPTDY
jgi:hypothetical protein